MFDVNILQPGDILILNRKGKSGSLFSTLQRFFTRMPYTHCQLVVDPVENIISVFEAEQLVLINPAQRTFQEIDTEIEVWHPLFITDKTQLTAIFKDLYDNYSGISYGFLQITFFVYRWINEVFKHNVNNKPNPFQNGVICSELIYYYLCSFVNSELSNKLSEWNANTVHAGDIHNILTSLPSLFKLTYTRKDNGEIYY